MQEFLARAIAQGRGAAARRSRAEGRPVFDLVTGELTKSDVAICGDRIVGVQGDYRGAREIDVSGRIVVPGFIDTHCHVESSLVTPPEFDRCALAHGVTTAICDPHEIANVLGVAGPALFPRLLADDGDGFARAALELRAGDASGDFRRAAGGRRPAAVRRSPQSARPRRIHEFPRRARARPGCLAKLAAFQDRRIDGHAPLLRGLDLNGYLAAGIRTDHETTNVPEALEKLSKGMQILVREGSVSKDLHALAPIITERHSPFLAFCTDDRNPLDIAEEGHLDFVIRTAIALGAPPLAAYRAASISAARIFGLHDRGLVAPGWRADLCVIDDLDACAVSLVLTGGRVVDEALFAGAAAGRAGRAPQRQGAAGRRRRISPRAARGRRRRRSASSPARSSPSACPSRCRSPTACAAIDLAQDLVKVAVVARHGVNDNIGVAFVQRLRHEARRHRLVGRPRLPQHHGRRRRRGRHGGRGQPADRDRGRLRRRRGRPGSGGTGAAGRGADEPAGFDEVRQALIPLRAAAKALGVVLPEPFLQVAFLPLPVIPHLKITDTGLVDVDRFEFVRD